MLFKAFLNLFYLLQFIYLLLLLLLHMIKFIILHQYHIKFISCIK